MKQKVKPRFIPWQC